MSGYVPQTRLTLLAVSPYYGVWEDKKSMAARVMAIATTIV